MRPAYSTYLLTYLVSLRVMTVATNTEQRNDGPEGCPPTYWDEPSSRCSSYLLSILETIHPENDFWFVPHVVNATCSAWQRTNTCYKQLLQSCHKVERAVLELQMHVERFHIFSLACEVSSTKGDNKYVVDCFIPRMKRIMQCSRSFDNVFRNYVTEKNFRHACRVVSATMNCFNVIRSQISASCNEEVSENFVRTFVRPLADQSRSTVLRHCEMMPSYSEYFTSDANSIRDQTLTLVVCCCCCCCCCLVLLLLVAEQIMDGMAETWCPSKEQIEFKDFSNRSPEFQPRFTDHPSERFEHKGGTISLCGTLPSKSRTNHPKADDNLILALNYQEGVILSLVRSFFQSLGRSSSSSSSSSLSLSSLPTLSSSSSAATRPLPQAFRSAATNTRWNLKICSRNSFEIPSGGMGIPDHESTCVSGYTCPMTSACDL